MKTFISFLILCLVATCNAELRTWTAINGKEVEAEFVSNEKGVVKLKLNSGKVFEVPLNKLSKGDQEFLTAKSSPKQTTKEETPVNPNLKYEVKDGAVTITGYDSKASGELKIPATIEGKTVTSIGEEALVICTNLKSIIIPDSVTSIGKSAFIHCTNLKSITFGKNSKLTSIESQAFGDCSNLKSIIIPDSVTSIGIMFFGCCSNLKSIIIPDSVTSIGKSTFVICTSLTNITVPNSVTSIGDFAFRGCSSLSTITIPQSVTSIGLGAFRGCSTLTSITIPDGVTSIGGFAFADCSRLSTVTFLGDAPKEENRVFFDSFPAIYRKTEAKGWGETFAGRPVKLISEKP